MHGAQLHQPIGIGGRRLRVLHIAPDLGQGGAERVLWQMARRSGDGMDHRLLLMQDRVFFDRRELDITALDFDLLRPASAMFRLLPALREINRLIEKETPDVVAGWLYYGAVLTSLASCRVPRVWAIHNTTLPSPRKKPILRSVNRLLARMSATVPARIVYCAEAARAVHEADGYAAAKGAVIENGVDTAVFREDVNCRHASRAALGLNGDVKVVGLFCRWDRQKNIPGCLDAIELASREIPNVVIMLAGRGMTPENTELVHEIERRGLTKSCRLIGPVQSMETLMRCADVVLLGSSYGEALPMVLLEALACGVPIAATRVGDVPRIGVPDAALAELDNPRQLADAMLFAIRTAGKSSWDLAIQRARTHYTVERCISRHLDLFSSLATVDGRERMA